MVKAAMAGSAISDPYAVLPASARAKLRVAAVPDWTSPMLATLTDRRFSDPAWVFERKLDGERCLAFTRAGRVTLKSRNGNAGALLVGYFDGDRLVYAGKVGTGFDTATLRDLHGRMRELETEQSPFVSAGTARRDVAGAAVHWVRPALVAQVGFSEWTADGRLRHPRYEGLRSDKDAREVVRERPAP